MERMKAALVSLREKVRRNVPLILKSLLEDEGIRNLNPGWRRKESTI